MTQPAILPPLTEQEFDRLEALLDSDLFDGKAMSLDALQGFLCAVISGPETIVPSVWMPAALGEPLYENPQQAEEVLDLVMRYYDDIAASLQQGEGMSFTVYHPDDSEDYDFETWCAGYLEGVELSEVDWYEAGDPEEVDELLFPIAVLARDLDILREPDQRVITEKEKAGLEADCRESLAATLIQIYRYWLARQSGPTVRREAPKVGRNDPCPCGSGKKFKRCCGAAGALH
jgi:uncharacterized protein